MRVFVFLLIVLTCSCSKSDSITLNSCPVAIFNESKFNSTEHFGMELLEYAIDDNCLKVKLQLSGCDANHAIEMVSDGRFNYTDPPRITFDFYDNNPQLCKALFIVDREYDLSFLKDEHNDDIIVIFRDNKGQVKI